MRRATLLFLMLLVTFAGPNSGCADEACEPAPEHGLGEPVSWELSYPKGEPELAEDFPEWRTMIATDGLPLAHTEWRPDGWQGHRPVVLFVHGSSAYGKLYHQLARALRDAEIFVRLIDLRGHGRSTCDAEGRCGAELGSRSVADDGRYWVGRAGDAADVDQIARDLHQHIDELRRAWPGAPIWLVGHSSGAGALAHLAVNAGMSGIEGSVLLAPFIHEDQPQAVKGSWECGLVVGSPYAHVDLPTLGEALRGDIHRFTTTFHKADAYVTPDDTLSISYTMMRALSAPDADGFHQHFAGPVQWIVAEEDALLDVEASRREFLRMPGATQFLRVQNTSHVGLLWSRTVGQAIATFIVGTHREPERFIDPTKSRIP